MCFVLSLVFALVAARCIQGYRVIDVHGVRTVLAVESEDVVVSCEQDVPMSYCGFTHPNGTRFSFAGASLNSGQCHIELKVTRADSGRWTCHIGQLDRAGEEITQAQEMRVAGKLAAVVTNVTVTHGKPVTLSCTTPHKMVPLRYCRFVPPRGGPFSINGDVTRNNSILDRFYFPANKSLDRGDCAVTLAAVRYEDAGLWTCGAWLEDDSEEFVDYVEVKVEGMYAMSTASVTGIVSGAVAVVLLLTAGALVAWRRSARAVAAAPDTLEMARLRAGGTPSPVVPRLQVEPPAEGEPAQAQN